MVVALAIAAMFAVARCSKRWQQRVSRKQTVSGDTFELKVSPHNSSDSSIEKYSEMYDSWPPTGDRYARLSSASANYLIWCLIDILALLYLRGNAGFPLGIRVRSVHSCSLCAWATALGS